MESVGKNATPKIRQNRNACRGLVLRSQSNHTTLLPIRGERFSCFVAIDSEPARSLVRGFVNALLCALVAIATGLAVLAVAS